MGSACSCGSKDPDPSSPTPEKAKKKNSTGNGVNENGAPPSSPPLPPPPPDPPAPVNGHIQKKGESGEEEDEKMAEKKKYKPADIPITITPCSSPGSCSPTWLPSPPDSPTPEEEPPDTPPDPPVCSEDSPTHCHAPGHCSTPPEGPPKGNPSPQKCEGSQCGSECSNPDEIEEESEEMSAELASLVTRLETAVDKLEMVSGAKTSSSSSAKQEECSVPYVVAYDDLLSSSFKTFFECSKKIGGDVEAMAKLVQEALINQRAFLVMASKSQKPLDSELPQVLEPTGKKIQEVIAFRESKRQSPLFNHLSAISESIPGLSWVAVAPAPAPYVKEMGDSAVFYTNRVLKDYREKDKLHVEWVQHWNGVFRELHEYVKKYHTTGLSWNTRGGNAMGNLKSAPPGCGVPPPPPPGIPPPPPMVKLEPKAGAAGGGGDDGRSALFASINQGTAITSGLKKVSDDMKTHKNPGLREGPKPFVKQSSPTATANKPRDPFSGTPRKVLEGKKWFVEYQKDKQDIVISEARMDQSIYIFRCMNTVVQVKGKVNSVILDSCKKSSVVFDNLVSSAEVVNCQSCQVQVMGVMPIISIEKTDGCQVYLSKESLNTEIVTAKSTEMNILVPKPDGEFAELPIPEQFKTVIKDMKLVTTCAEKTG